MPLPDHKIRRWAQNGGVSPFDPSLLNPASLDLRLGDAWRDVENPEGLIFAEEFILYPKTISTEIYNLIARKLGLKTRPTSVFAITMEWVTLPDTMAGMLKLKTTPIREGLVYPIADWVDPGFSGKLTLMLSTNVKTTLRCGQRVVQLVLEEMEACEVPYSLKGHYNYQVVPTLSWRRNNGRADGRLASRHDEAVAREHQEV
jgi:dCTP deaminase